MNMTAEMLQRYAFQEMPHEVPNNAHLTDCPERTIVVESTDEEQVADGVVATLLTCRVGCPHGESTKLWIRSFFVAGATIDEECPARS